MSDDPLGTIFRPVHTPRASEQIAARIQHAIRRGVLPLGAQLPPERTLSEQLKVSRVTVRDALRILQARGLVEVRVGAQGGAFVTAPRTDLVAQGLADLIVLSDSSAEHVTEARQVFELALIPLVCKYAEAHDLADLEQLCDRAEASLAAGSWDPGHSAAFHIRLARASHNEVIAVMAEVMHAPMVASLRRAQAHAPEMGRIGVREHRKLITAVRDVDVDRATMVMTRHLDRTARRLRSAGEVSNGPDAGAATGAGRPGGQTGVRAASPELPDVREGRGS